jgi:hypothetical protein
MNYAETLSTLRYADRAKQIKTKVSLLLSFLASFHVISPFFTSSPLYSLCSHPDFVSSFHILASHLPLNMLPFTF